MNESLLEQTNTHTLETIYLKENENNNNQQKTS